MPRRTREELPDYARIVADARVILGGNQAIADAVTSAGILSAGKPYSMTSASKWANAEAIPASDVLFAIARAAGLRIDDYVRSDDGGQIALTVQQLGALTDRVADQLARRYPRRYPWRYEPKAVTAVDSANSANPRTKPTYHRRFELIRLTVGELLDTAAQLITQQLAQSQPSLTLALHA